MAAARMTDMPETVTPVEALLMIDIQAGHVSGLGAVPDAARLVENAADLLGKARASGALVVHCAERWAGGQGGRARNVWLGAAPIG